MEIVLIPAKSTIPSALEKQRQQEARGVVARSKPDDRVGLHSVDEQVTLDGLPAENRHAEQVGQSATRNPVASNPDVSDSSSTEMFLLTKPELPESLGKVDPIAESPTSVWYFRSRKLGEKGPLKGKVMREYVDRGDVCIGCIVWREDWEDWVPAEKVFPRLVAEAKSKRSQQKTHRALKDANYQIPEELDPLSELSRKRRKKVLIFRSLIGTGFLIICVLIYVLIRLLSQ